MALRGDRYKQVISFGIKAFTRDEVNVCDFYDGHNLFNIALYNRGGRECHEPLRVVLGNQAKYYRERD